jgi:hypothetical protein
VKNPKQVSGEELGAIAKQMIEAPTKSESDALEERLIEGFYDGKPPLPPLLDGKQSRLGRSPTSRR